MCLGQRDTEPSCRNCWDGAEEHFLLSPMLGSLYFGPRSDIQDFKGEVQHSVSSPFISARPGQICTVQADQPLLTQASSKRNQWQLSFRPLYREVTRNHLKTVPTKQHDSQQPLHIQEVFTFFLSKQICSASFYLSPQRDFLHQIIVWGRIWMMWTDAMPCFWGQVLQQ